MPTFTNVDDVGQFVVEYDKIHYALVSNDYMVNFALAYELLEDGSDKDDYEADAIAKFNTICAMYPGKTWRIVKNVQNKREEYIPAIPMSENDFFPDEEE